MRRIHLQYINLKNTANVSLAVLLLVFTSTGCGTDTKRKEDQIVDLKDLEARAEIAEPRVVEKDMQERAVNQLKVGVTAAIREGDMPALGQHWQQLQHQMIGYPKIEGEVSTIINHAISEQIIAFKDHIIAGDLDGAEEQLALLVRIKAHLPGVILRNCDISEFRQNLAHSRARHWNQQRTQASEIRQPRQVTDEQASVASEAIISSPQEILDKKLRDPETVLTPNQSITLLNYCTELGEQNAAHAEEQTVSIFMGNTGTGKSTTLNALLGCRMRAEFDSMDEEIIIVDPSSPREEVMPIGHGRRSRTFVPQIAQDPDHPNRVYCDCPGFYDTRGAEINIANAINIRKILQQATGVKAIFLTSYHGLFADRGTLMQVLESMCHQMFGDTENLRRYQDSVLLGITKAPLYNRRGQPVSINSVRSRLTQNNTPIAQILANRIFLFDPLDRAMDNPDFWSLARCRDQIDRLASIPQHEATTLFQTALTDSNRTHLLNTIRQLIPKMVNAVGEGDVTRLSQHWQLLQRLRATEHPEVEQLIEGQVLPAINVALRQLGDIETWTNAYEFDHAEAHIARLRQFMQHLPGATLDINLDGIAPTSCPL